MATTRSSESGIRDLALTFGGQTGALLIGIVAQMVLARALGPAGRGSYETCLLFGSMLILVCNFGAEMSTMYMISSARIPVRSGLINGMTYALIVSGAAVLLGLLLIRFPLPGLDGMFRKATPGLFVLGLITGPATLLSLTMTAVLQALKRFSQFSAMLLLGRAAGLALLVFLIWMPGREVAGALNALTFSRVLVLLAILYLLHRSGDMGWERPRGAHLRTLFSYGTRYYLGKLSNMINFRVGSIVLMLLASREDMGLYGQALAIALNLMILPDSLFTVLLPRASEDGAGRIEVVAQAARLVLLFGVVAVVAAYFLAEPVFRWALTEAFVPSAGLFKVLILGFAFRAYGKMFEPYLIGTDRPGKLSMAVAIGVAVNVILLAVLMPRMGVAGAAWALVGNYLASTVVIAAIYLSASGAGLGACLVPRSEDFRLMRSLALGTLRRERGRK